MSFNIAEFSSHIKEYGTIQTNKFFVEIPPPRFFAPSQFEAVIMYRANSINIPGATFDFQNVYRYGIGPQEKVPTNIHFTDVRITFLDTVENALWKRFAAWFNGIFDFTGPAGGEIPSYTAEYKDYYTTNVKIYLFDNEGVARTGVVLKDAFPTSLSDVSLSWSENNKLYEFTVGFTFREWYYDGYLTYAQSPRSYLGPGLSGTPIPQRTDSPRSVVRPTQEQRDDLILPGVTRTQEGQSFDILGGGFGNPAAMDVPPFNSKAETAMGRRR